jgi:regulator of nucleoside diphosphate kinase
MSEPHHCQLTTKDYCTLEALLEPAWVSHHETYRRLLRRKLSTARIVFPDAISPEIATINSRVEFTVDDGVADNRILIHGRDNVFPGLTLPITTLRGLALLGLAAGETITIENPDGRREALRLEWVSHQPEASRRGVPHSPPRMRGNPAMERFPSKPAMPGHPGLDREDKTEPPRSLESGGNTMGPIVVQLSAHRKLATAGPAPAPLLSDDDDDPGPSAA